MKRLHDLVGGEHDLAEVAREIRAAVRGLAPTAVGGFHITCSDESEHECTEAFQRGFALELLPRLKYGERVPFRIANPGARYEWGAVRIAEDHFATEEARRGFHALVIKINGHVAYTQSGPDGRAFGRMERYGDDSVYCGAIAAVLAGSELPFAQDMRTDLLSEENDRLATLRADALAADGRNALFGALASARLQARKCVLDIQDHQPAAPTVYVVVHGVTLNKPGPDTEVVGGLYVLDHRTPKRVERYRGLGDDPAGYRLDLDGGRLVVRDAQSGRERPARDHRALAGERLGALRAGARAIGEHAARALAGAGAAPEAKGAVSRSVLKGALAGLSLTSPEVAALVLLAEGAAGIHHARKLGQSVDAETQSQLAREVVQSVHDQVDDLPPPVAARVLEALRREFASAKAR